MQQLLKIFKKLLYYVGTERNPIEKGAGNGAKDHRPSKGRL
jgi:hypothetical protein